MLVNVSQGVYVYLELWRQILSMSCGYPPRERGFGRRLGLIVALSDARLSLAHKGTSVETTTSS